MCRMILCALSALMLCGCSTPQPVSVTVRCQPPAPLLVQAAPLQVLAPLGPMPLPEAMSAWAEDRGQYRTLADQHDRLVGWLAQRC